MAVSQGGINGPVVGKLNKLVSYVLNGQVVVRSIGTVTAQSTVPQLSARMKTSISSKLLKVLQEFFNVGFSIEVKGSTKNAFNKAVEINSRKMTVGVYPNFQVDYSKIELSRGILKKGENLLAAATDELISFSWTADLKMAWPESTDLVMMIAYFPQENRSVYKIGGNPRSTGADTLTLPPSLKGLHAETYMAFVAADRKQVSDSTYLGSLNLPVQQP